MTKLYINGRIKVDLIEDALMNAIDEGKLPNVPRTKIKYFVQGFEKKIKEFSRDGRDVGTQITQSEVEDLFESMELDKHDKILDRELRVIKKILTDKKFNLE
ncbi:MAG: hypothetical protein KAI70_03740 [Candidatus Omnitrophica bacterium]|nr:hypothetical protein [Candidatus Omnitrophota bacterium]